MCMMRYHCARPLRIQCTDRETDECSAMSSAAWDQAPACALRTHRSANATMARHDVHLSSIPTQQSQLQQVSTVWIRYERAAAE